MALNWVKRPSSGWDPIAHRSARAAQNVRSVTPSPAESSRRIKAQVLRSIIAPVTHESNTVGDRVMSGLLDLPRRNSSPEVLRVFVRS